MNLPESALASSWFWPVVGLVAALLVLAISWPFFLRRTLENSATWTKFQRALGLAIRSLWLQKLRAFLSVLGIIIGTGSVIALMAFGEGSMQDALDDIKRQGATNVIVRSVKPPDEGATAARSFVADFGLKYKDVAKFRTIPEIDVLVPMRVFPQ